MSLGAIRAAYRPFLMSLLAIACPLVRTAPAQIDYFPDIPIGSQHVAFETVTDINAARDLQEIPDGSGRMLANRAANRLQIIQPSGSNSTFLRACPCDVAGTQGMNSFSIHPGFADVNSPGYAKIYTLTVDLMNSEPPDFASPGPNPGFQYLLTEWTMNNIRSNAFSGSSRVLMRVAIQDSNHDVNDLAFGPDENLYISLGEDDNRELSSSTDNIFGKILRIDPFGDNSANGQYGIPADNPFAGDPDSVGEIFAYGLRNPWRIWFDRATGDMFAADVGWRSIEEVDRIVRGGNFGWPTKEGSLLAASEAIPDVPDPVTGLTKAEELGLIEPIFEYDHTDGESVIGGVVYRGSELPWLVGKVIFGDWETRLIMAGDPETGEFFQLPFAEDEVANAIGGADLKFTSINEDLDGELYLLGGTQIARITALPGDINRDGTVAPTTLTCCTPAWDQTIRDTTWTTTALLTPVTSMTLCWTSWTRRTVTPIWTGWSMKMISRFGVRTCSRQMPVGPPATSTATFGLTVPTSTCSLTASTPANERWPVRPSHLPHSRCFLAQRSSSCDEDNTSVKWTEIRVASETQPSRLNDRARLSGTAREPWGGWAWVYSHLDRPHRAPLGGASDSTLRRRR